MGLDRGVLFDDSPDLPLPTDAPRRRPRRDHRGARALTATFFGMVVRPHGDPVWTRTVVAAMALVGVAEANTRQALARLAAAGVLEPERVGRSARWWFTERGLDVLDRTESRLFGFAAETRDWDGRWLLVLTNAGVSAGDQRHALRSRLGWAGFASPAPGVWISPHVAREQEAMEVLAQLGLSDGVQTFHARPGSLTTGSPDTAWDIRTLAREYRAFEDEFGAAGAVDDAHDLAVLVRIAHAWQRFPGLDPGLPTALLPSDWAGRRAKATFDRLVGATRPGALRWIAAAAND